MMQEDDYLNSAEFQKILENSILDPKAEIPQTYHFTEEVNIESPDSENFKNLKSKEGAFFRNVIQDEQNLAYQESLKIDKARLFIALSLQKVYRKYCLKKDTWYKIKYQKYQELWEKKGKMIKVVTDSSWIIDYEKYLEKERTRLKRLQYFNK